MDSIPEMPDFERLLRGQDIYMLLPFVVPVGEGDGEDSESETRNRVFLVNPFTRSMIVLEGPQDLESLLRGLSSKDEPLPASKAAIDAMPMVTIAGGGECSICLDDLPAGGEAREMPCRHRYHSNCIEKWLGINGSCPVCRYKMPAEEADHKKNDGGDEEGRREILVRIYMNDRDRSSSDPNPESQPGDTGSDSRPDGEAVVDDLSSTQDTES